MRANRLLRDAMSPLPEVSVRLSEVRFLCQDPVTLVMLAGSVLIGKSTLQMTGLAVDTASYFLPSFLTLGFYLALSTFGTLLFFTWP